MLSVHRQRFLIVFALPCLAHIQVLYGGSEWLKKKKKRGQLQAVYCHSKVKFTVKLNIKKDNLMLCIQNNHIALPKQSLFSIMLT